MFRAREKLLLFQKYILLTKLKSNDVNFSNYEVFEMLLWQFVAAKFEILLTFKVNWRFHQDKLFVHSHLKLLQFYFDVFPAVKFATFKVIVKLRSRSSSGCCQRWFQLKFNVYEGLQDLLLPTYCLELKNQNSFQVIWAWH